MRPYCTHALPNCCVGRGEVHACGSTGAFQRSSPMGGLANGTPSQAYVPVVAESSLPTTMPNSVRRSAGECAPAPQADCTESATQATSSQPVQVRVCGIVVGSDDSA